MAMFTIRDVGCIIDGVRGHVAVREGIASLMHQLLNGAYLMPGNQTREAEEILRALRAPMSDDASEELDALDVLTLASTDGNVLLEMVDGDLMCSAVGWCVVVRDRFGSVHADRFEPESETAPDEAKALVLRLGLNDTPGETFEWCTFPLSDPGLARLRAWAGATWAAGAGETGSFEMDGDE